MPTLDALPLFDFMLRTSNATFASFITQKRQKTWDKKNQKKYKAITYSLDLHTTFLDISAVSRNTTSSILKTC